MPVAINIRGTGGSGKSTLVRNVMATYPAKMNVEEPGRKRPSGYILSGEGRATLYVPGHYETACGGCDTIKTMDKVYEQVIDGLELGFNVLYEGIMPMDDVRRAVELNKTHQLDVIYLTTPIEDCLEGIQARRRAAAEARGKEPGELNPKNTIERARRAEGVLKRLIAGGVPVHRMGREDALDYILGRLDAK